MEIQIDTSILSSNSKTNLSKVEDSIISDLDQFIHSNITENNHKEHFLIKIQFFMLENTKEKSLVVYGNIVENNQKFYEYDKHDKIFLYTKEASVINLLISNFTKGIELRMKFYLENCICIRLPKKREITATSDNHYNNYIFALFLSPILKFYFSIFAKFKFNKWENIFINSNYYEEAFTLSLVMSIIGYEVIVNTEYFRENDVKAYIQEDFNFNDFNKDIINKCELLQINFSNESIKSETKYNFILDTTGDLLLEQHKLQTFSQLNFEGKLIILSTDSKHSEYQLDPRDLEFLSSKNNLFSLTNLKNSLKFNKTLGRELNFLNEIFEKIMTNFNTQSTKHLFKKLDCKIVDMKEHLKEITKEEIDLSKNFINLYIL